MKTSINLKLWTIGAIIIAALVTLLLGRSGAEVPVPKKAVLTFDPVTGAKYYKIIIAENGCHYGGWGLHRATVTEPRFEIGNVCDLQLPLFMQVTAGNEKGESAPAKDWSSK